MKQIPLELGWTVRRVSRMWDGAREEDMGSLGKAGMADHRRPFGETSLPALSVAKSFGRYREDAFASFRRVLAFVTDYVKEDRGPAALFLMPVDAKQPVRGVRRRWLESSVTTPWPTRRGVAVDHERNPAMMKTSGGRSSNSVPVEPMNLNIAGYA